MVVGNEEVNSQGGGLVRLREVGDAAVASYYEARALVSQGLDSGCLQTVAILEPVGNVGDGMGAKYLQGLYYDRG